MTTVGDLCSEVRSKLQGSLPDVLNVLAADYVPGSGALSLRYPTVNLTQGSVISVGLNTFYVMESDQAGQSLRVYPKADGGPDVAAAAGDLALTSPRYTTWSIFREMGNEIASLTSPMNGLYGYGTVQYNTDYTFGVYHLPTPAWDAFYPLRILSSKYLRNGSSQQWQRMEGATYQPENRSIRVLGNPPVGSFVEFVLAFPFNLPTSLTQDVATLGMPAQAQGVPGLGVCATLSRSTEGRRNQIMSQGDSRRPTEVPAGANLGPARDWAQDYAAAIREEQARLVQQFGWKRPNVAGISWP